MKHSNSTMHKEAQSLDPAAAIKAIEQLHRSSMSETYQRYSESAEMKLVQAIHDHEGLHVIGLAKVLGITKGAVSQTLAKLEKKSLIRKETDPDNASRLNIKLTDRGLELYEAHEQYHRELNRMVLDLANELEPEVLTYLKIVLKKINQKIDEEWTVLGNYLLEEKKEDEQ